MPRRRRLSIRIARACLLLLAAPAGLPAQDLDVEELLVSAARLEAEGKTAEAAALYNRWLENDPDKERLFGVLVQALKLETSAASALELLAAYTPAVPDVQDRHTLVYNRALILEMLGRLEEALDLYAELPAYGQVLYKRALVLFELGNLQEAEKHLLAVEAEVEDKEIRARALNLRIRLYLAADRRAEAERTFEELQRDYADVSTAPVFLLAHLEYLLASGRRPEAEAQLATLKQRFPASPEYRLAESAFRGEDYGEKAVDYAPAPWRLLAPLTGNAAAAEAPGPPSPRAVDGGGRGESGEGPGAAATEGAGAAAAETGKPASPPRVMVQAGSFSVAENAGYLERDLAARGFSARVAEVNLEGKTYYRVLVGPEGDMEAAQQLLLRLKDAGFEGVLLWSED